MTTQQKQEIEKLFPIISEFQAKKSVVIPTDQKLTIKKIYKEIYPNSRPDISCGQCVLSMIHQLLTYYDKNKPVQVKQPEVKEPEVKQSQTKQPEEKKKRVYKKKK